MNYLQEQKKSGILSNEWSQIEDFYNRKLWHQLTLKIADLIKRAEIQRGQEAIKLYENFISDFEHRINALSLVEICLFVYKQYSSNELAIAYLEKLREKVKQDEEARILCTTTIGNILLNDGKFDLVKKLIEETELELDSIVGITSVHARFYELASNYNRAIGNHGEYFKNALRYLGCVNYDTFSKEEKQERAFFLGIAAILGEGVYNFGELLMHPIIESLKQTQNNWLYDLLFAFNRGDLDKFEQLKSYWSQLADLKAAEVDMRKKICLLCLMEMSFSRPSSNRQLTFNEIALRAKLPVNEVELLVMRALSLELIRGSIDEVDNKVYIQWVQPRVFDMNQIKLMRSRLDCWSTEIGRMIAQIQDTAHEILQ